MGVHGYSGNAISTTNRYLVVSNPADSLEFASEHHPGIVESLFHTTNVSVIGLDCTGRVMLVNEGYANITGYTFSEIKNKDWFCFFHSPATAHALRSRFLNIQAENPLEEFVDAIRTKDRVLLPIRWHVVQLHYARDRRNGYLLIGMNHFRNDQTANLLHQNIENSNTATPASARENISAGSGDPPGLLVAFLDPLGNYQRANNAHQDWFNIDARNITGQAWTKVWGPANAHALSGRFASVMDGHSVNFVASVLVGGTSAPRYLHLSMAPTYDPQGYVNGFFYVGNDMTHYKLNELLEKRHMVSLSHHSRHFSLSGLTKEIAHEISQPLTAIATFSHALLRIMQTDDYSHDQARHILGNIVQLAENTGEIIHRFKNMSNKRNIQLSPVNINTIVMNLAHLIRFESDWHKIALQLELESELPLILGDAELLEQVVLNLILNALETMAKIAQVNNILTIRSTTTDDCVCLSIEDQGLHLSDNEIEKIFKAFNSTKDEGMGLGLPMCKDILEIHGGRLLAEANEIGMSFGLQIPIYRIEGDDNGTGRKC